MSKAAQPLSGRSGFSDIHRFPPDLQPCSIDLTDNTNLWGAPPSAERIVREEATRSLARYPEPYSETLKDRLAEYVGVAPENMVIGCGSDDVLDSSIRAFGNPGDTIALPDPTFSMLPFFARANAIQPVFITLTADYDVDIERTLATKAKITYLCSPGNPTGKSMRRETIEAIVDRATGLVIVDEAYAEFAGRSAVDFIKRSDRVVVVRTLSKAFGLAGLRVGYGMASPEVVHEIEKARGPFKVSSTAERAAVAALTNDMAWIRERVAEAIENRERFVRALEGFGLEAIESDTNFVLVPVKNAATIAARMRNLDVALKAFEHLPHAPDSTLAASGGDALRITIGPWPLMQRVLDSLPQALT